MVLRDLAKLDTDDVVAGTTDPQAILNRLDTDPGLGQCRDNGTKVAVIGTFQHHITTRRTACSA